MKISELMKFLRMFNSSRDVKAFDQGVREITTAIRKTRNGTFHPLLVVGPKRGSAKPKERHEKRNQKAFKRNGRQTAKSASKGGKTSA
jgi:hypothetical protein